MGTRKIGSYRLLGELGRGGMGVVWEGWDERLGRRVAIKEIRAGGDEDRRRRRLRREARTVAQLNHPAIVQIFDVLEEGGGDWIVMEYVPGGALAARLRSGPLALEQTLTLARDVAEGLAEAHDRGFLHRDLKTENVLVTPGGRAKILDFGLAKALREAPGDSGLTRTDELVGTYRAMSPELIQGEELDARSDLFSLGVLLYEMATGRSPFRAQTPAETLERAFCFRQAPAGELNPALPAALVELIDELLAKERDRRPPSARAVALRLGEIRPASASGSGALAAGGFDPSTIVDGSSATASTLAALRSKSKRPSKRRVARVVLFAALAGLAAALLIVRHAALRAPSVVAVAPVTVGAGAERAEVALAAAAVRAALLRTLLGLAGTVPVTADDRKPGAETSQDLARVLAADEVLTSRLDCEPEICQLVIERRRGDGGGLLALQTTEIPLDDLPLAATATHSAARRFYPRQRWSAGMAELNVEAADYSRYLEVERAFRTRAEDWIREQGVTELEAIRRGSPRFLEAYLLEVMILIDLHFDSRAATDFEASLELLETARRLAPDDPRVASATFHLELARGELAGAEAALAKLELVAPGDPATLTRRAHLAERYDQSSEALEMMRLAARRRPAWRHLLMLANLEIRQGELEGARKTLSEMGRRFPEDLESRTLLAQLELLSGDPARAAELYEELIARVPRFADLTNLGTAKLLLGRFEEAAESFRSALDLVPTNPGAVLNLADAELLRGNADAARRLYRRVIELIAADPAAEGSWQWLSVRAQAHAHLGEAREAVTLVRRAEQLASRNPQAFYEAALVYAVVGDDTSALINAEKALEGGVEAHWFDFPWFSDLRQASQLGGTRSPTAPASAGPSD